jgi:hypothetical protein
LPAMDETPKLQGRRRDGCWFILAGERNNNTCERERERVELRFTWREGDSAIPSRGR